MKNSILWGQARPPIIDLLVGVWVGIKRMGFCILLQINHKIIFNL